MATTVTVEHADSSTETVSHIASEVVDHMGRMSYARIRTTRDSVNGLSTPLDEHGTEVTLAVDGTDRFGGILRSANRDGSIVELFVDSYEVLALKAQPSGASETFSSDDAAIVTDAITDTSGLSAGTVTAQEASLTHTFQHTSPARRIRWTEEAAGAEVKYNPDATVDYVETLGADKTGTVLSPANQNLGTPFVVYSDERDGEVTHLRMLGAGTGEHQLTAEVSLTTDSPTTTTTVSATTTTVTATPTTTPVLGDGVAPSTFTVSAISTRGHAAPTTATASTTATAERWTTHAATDVANETTLTTMGHNLLAEYKLPFESIRATVYDSVVDLGDEFTVTHTDQGIDGRYRAMRVSEMNDAGGRRFIVRFAKTERAVDRAGTKHRLDIERYNSQGANIRSRVPEYADTASAPNTTGHVVYIDGSGTDAEGYWGYTSSGWVQLG